MDIVSEMLYSIGRQSVQRALIYLEGLAGDYAIFIDKVIFQPATDAGDNGPQCPSQIQTRIKTWIIAINVEATTECHSSHARIIHITKLCINPKVIFFEIIFA